MNGLEIDSNIFDIMGVSDEALTETTETIPDESEEVVKTSEDTGGVLIAEDLDNEEEADEVDNSAVSSEVEEEEIEGASFNDVIAEFSKFGLGELTEEQQSELDSIESVDDKYTKFMELQSQQKQDAIYQGIDQLIESIPDDKLKQTIALAVDGVKFEEAVELVMQKQAAYSVKENDLVDNIELQRNAVKQYLKSIGTDKSDIEDQLEYLESTDKLEKKSLEYHKKNIKLVEQAEINKKQAVKDQQLQLKQKNDQIVSQYETAIDNLKEVIPGNPISKKELEGIKEILFNKVQTDKGIVTPVQLARQEDPIWFDIWLAHQIKNGYHKKNSKAWDSVKKSGKTEQTNFMINKLKKGVITGKSNTTREDKVGSFASKFGLK